jgi:hypothetical protein
MKPLTIIEYHHVIEHDQACRFACGKVTEFGTLSAQGRKTSISAATLAKWPPNFRALSELSTV